MRWALALCGLASCQLAFPASARDPLDGPPPELCPVAPSDCGGAAPDEDGDGPRDDCDPCPQLANAADDADRDGIGDACDPAPAQPQRCRERWFLGFSPSSADHLLTGGQAWVFDGVAAPEDPDLASDALRVLTRELHGPGRYETLVLDGNPLIDQDDLHAGVAAMAGVDAGFACVLRQDPQGARGTLALLDLDEDEVLDESMSSIGVTPGLAHRVQLDVSADGLLSCRSLRDGEVELELAVRVALPAGGGRAGIVLRGSTATFGYLDVIAE